MCLFYRYFKAAFFVKISARKYSTDCFDSQCLLEWLEEKHQSEQESFEIEAKSEWKPHVPAFDFNKLETDVLSDLEFIQYGSNHDYNENGFGFDMFGNEKDESTSVFKTVGTARNETFTLHEEL